MTTPSKPSVVVFDLGKVLVDFDYSIATRRIAACSRKPLDFARFFVDHAALLVRYELGLATTMEFFEAVREVTGFAKTAEEFGQFFADIFTPMECMLELHAQLRRQRVPCYIFSNTNELAVRHIGERFPFYNEFDGYILSYEHGAMKPDAKLYEVVEQKTGKRGADIFYLDDRPENIATGIERGWQAVCHETPESSRAALEKTGIISSEG